MKPVERMYRTLCYEEPDVVPDGQDRASVPGAEAQVTIKSGPGFRVWKDNFGGVHIDIAHELMMDLESKVADLPVPPERGRIGHTWWYTIAPAVRFPEDLELIEPPTISPKKLELIKRRTKELHEKGLFVVTGHHSVFDASWRQLRGFRQWLIDCTRNPSFAKKIAAFVAKSFMEIDNAIIEEAGVDAVHVTGDQGTPEGPFLSPSRYKEIIHPWDRRMAQSFHKRGAFFFIHSHGYLMPILDDMVDAGFDMINPVSPLCRMNLAEVKERYGDRIALNADIAVPMERGTAPNKPGPKIDSLTYNRIYEGIAPVEEIVEALNYTIEIGASGGGFVFANGGLPRTEKVASQRQAQREALLSARQACLKAWEKLRQYPKKIAT